MKCSCPSVKGHLTNRSTAFAPCAVKYGTQSILHDHMMSHYQRVEKAKSVIDNKRPKSMNTFIKAHSKKLQFQKQKERLEQSRSESQLFDSENQFDQFDDASNQQLERTYQEEESPVSNKEQNIRPNSINSFEESFFERSSSELSFISKRSSTPISYKKASPIETRITGTPRYKVEMYSPDPDPLVLEGSIYNSMQPVLAASQWKRKAKSGLTQSQDGVSSDSNYIISNMNGLSLRSSGLNNSGHWSVNGNTEYERLRKQEELIAEEQAYLKFVEEVTTDVLARGIFSDRVLNQVFDTHIERQRGKLNEERMRGLIDELKADLNVDGEPVS